MDIEDIKSPLPPRKAVVPFDNEENSNQRVSLNQNQPITNLGPKIEVAQTIKEEPKKRIGKKFLMIILFLILVIGGGLVGLRLLNGNNKIGGGQIILKYWGLWEEESVMRAIIADFESKNPNIKVEYKRNLRDGYGSRLSGRLAKSGEVEDVPDIFRIHNTWMPMFRNYLAPVPEETMSKIGLENDFFDVYKDDLKEDGQYLSVPLMYDGLVMFYNPEILAKAQVEVPNNWWDLKKSAEKITERDANGIIRTAGAGIGVVENVDHWSDIVGLMLKQNGVNFNLMSAENEKNTKDVLDFYTLFRTSDKVWDETLPSSTQYFASGNLGFYFGPSWRVFDIQNLNPNLKFEITKMPQLPTIKSTSIDQIGNTTELTNIHWSTYWVEGVNNKSKYQKEAWKFLEYLSSVEVLEKWYQADSQIRSFGKIYPRKSMAEKISSNPKIKPFVESANNASSWYLASATGDDGVNQEMQKYFADAINGILLKNEKSEEVVKTVIQGINQLRQKYKLIK